MNDAAPQWDQHWDQFGEATKSNPAHRYRRQLLFDAIGKTPSRLIDLGCGQGDFLREAASRLAGCELVGIDGSEGAIRIAKSRTPQARYFQLDLERQPAPAELVGVASHIVCSEVIEHLDDPRHLLQLSRQMLAPGGRLIITVPGGPRTAFDKHIGHRRHYSPRALEKLCVSAGLAPEAVYGAGFPFFNLYRLAVLARGKRLIDDVAAPGGGASTIANAAMRVFNSLFALNHAHGRFGWQTFGIFRSGDRAAN